MTPINDWRKTLATFPNMNMMSVNVVAQYIIDSGMESSLLNAISVLTNPSYQINVDNSIRAKAREWLGLPNRWDLSLEYREDK
jgi:hypothetical protein